jgi:hypothetical protein
MSQKPCEPEKYATNTEGKADLSVDRKAACSWIMRHSSVLLLALLQSAVLFRVVTFLKIQ